jgi:nicotinate phosphoribosyltransferase
MGKNDHAFLEGALWVDQYQLTMAQLYFKQGYHEKEVRFEHFFRYYPDYGSHKAGYCINAGLEWLVSWLSNTKFLSLDLEMLRSQKTASGKQVFEKDFLNWLGSISFLDSLTIEAVPEGRVVHPWLPLTVVQGSFAVAQILETVLLNQLNYQILIATKASRIKMAGRDQQLLEFGTRRAHDRGVNAGVRAALIGGADYSSNVAASHFLGYEPKGTHSHAMVQFYMGLGMSEQEAFQFYADLYPDNCILLVDTINTLESGIPNAIRVFENLRKKGHQPVGVRLDSGDLAYLTIMAAQALNKAGFENVKIVLSNELDEMHIWQIITQIEEEVRQYNMDPDHLINRLVYGVGTRLITSAGDSALSGVYKLTSIRHEGQWLPSTKFSESLSKSIIPGNKKIWRIYGKSGKANTDCIALNDERLEENNTLSLYHPVDPDKSKTIQQSEIGRMEPLLEKIIDSGKVVYTFPSIDKIREQRRKDIACLDMGVKRLIQPHLYHVSLSEQLQQFKQQVAHAFKK